MLHRVHDDAHGADIKKLVKAQVLTHHLFVNRIDVLGAAAYLGLNPLFPQKNPDLVDAVLHELEALLAGFIKFPGDFFVDLGFGKAKPQVFKLPLHLPDTEAVCQGRIKRERFAPVFGGLRCSGRRKPPKRLQAACKPQNHHAQIVAHRQKHAS